MADTDIRSQKLEWIRDGSNWLLGVSTGALVLSATYFYDHFDRQPRFECLLVVAWISLIISALAGVFTSFSTWKDLKAPSPSGTPNAPLGGWVTGSYTIMMWTFLGGYLLLAISLLVNVAAGPAPSQKQKIEITLPSGVPANAIHVLLSPALPAQPAPPLKSPIISKTSQPAGSTATAH